MSRKLFLLIILLALGNISWGQLHVIQIEGRIRVNDKEYLKVGSIINDNPVLHFSGTKSLIRPSSSTSHWRKGINIV